MSWDVWIIRPPEGVEAVSDLTSGVVLSPFTRQEVHEAARAAFERVVAVDASTLQIDGPDVWVDFDINDSQDQVMLNVRSGSERLATVILEFAALLDARAMDLQTGDWLTEDDGYASYAAWGAYQQRVISESPSDTADGS